MTRWSTKEGYEWCARCDICDDWSIDERVSGGVAYEAAIEHIKAAHPGRNPRRNGGYTVWSRLL